jgi:hypothetical protein
MVRIILILALSILLVSCNMPTTPLATPTPDAVATQVSILLTRPPETPTQPPLPAATTIPTATATTELPTLTATSVSLTETATSTSTPTVVNDPPDWTDSLEGGKAFYRYENDNTRVTQENGHLSLTGINADGWLGWSLTFSRSPGDFRIEAVFIPQACSGSDLYGLVFRAPNANSGYFYGITCDGHYSLHARNFEDDSDTVLISSTSAPAILSGANQTNHLAVRAEGDKISLYANDTLLQEITDSTFSAGYFGAFIAANETTGFTVWMDEISLWNIP